MTGTNNLRIISNATTGTVTLATGAVNNAGTVTNTGAGTGTTTISAAVSSNVTGITESSATSALTVSGAVTVGAGNLTLTLVHATNTLADAGTLVVSGTGVLDLGGNSDTVAGVQLSGGTIQNGTLTSTAAYDLQSGTASAVLAGAVGVNKTTGGTVTFSGTGANTYTGVTTVSAGTLNLNKTAGQDAIAGNLTVSGGSVVLQANNQIKDAKNVVVSGGTLDVATFDDTVAGVQFTSGNINGSGGTLISSSAFDLQAGAVSAILGGGQWCEQDRRRHSEPDRVEQLYGSNHRERGSVDPGPCHEHLGRCKHAGGERHGSSGSWRQFGHGGRGAVERWHDPEWHADFDYGL